ncbi:MAG: hypothetical protein KKG33_06515 [candidate division Zixibacteria bacterium]|nr:hypothetical protein [candidate division Zixibacteria bacterium]MBU1470817.1 hypothetical protein [candidate division Zixibacteria bacterium]MBU2625196.1 hypothetical protein [candidate division Zixibacteria bacterium]
MNQDIKNNVTQPTDSAHTSLMVFLSAVFLTIRYSAKQVFANKFIYFISAAIALFLLIAVIYSLEEETPPAADAIFYFLLAPGTLLIFYPSVYSLQSDVDSRMLETLFGIPNYRYKVWLARSVVQYIVIALLLTGLALFSRYALADFSVVSMVPHVMFPILFLGSLAFMVSTMTRSGNGAAVVMVVIGLFFWIMQEPLEGSKWNLFLNPFAQVDPYEIFAWAETTLYNRIYLVIGSIVTTMYGLLRLQNREKFM